MRKSQYKKLILSKQIFVGLNVNFKLLARKNEMRVILLVK